MASDEFLKRIDKHMARGNEHMARGNELMARIDKHMARGNELMDDVRAEMQLTREFFAVAMARLEQMDKRNERWNRRAIAQIDENTDKLRALRDSVVAFMNRLDEGGAAPA